MSEKSRSIGSDVFGAALCGGAVGMAIVLEGYRIAMGAPGPEPLAILIFGCFGVFIGIVPGFAFAFALRRLYRKHSSSLEEAPSHRAFWMCLVFASSAIFSAAAGVYVGTR